MRQNNENGSGRDDGSPFYQAHRAVVISLKEIKRQSLNATHEISTYKVGEEEYDQALIYGVQNIDPERTWQVELQGITCRCSYSK